MGTNGIIVIDKPAGWTSMDVCAKLRGMYREKRIGHAGTLDPMATGVLPVFIGRATRAVEFASEGEKEYVAGLKLGLITNTQDTSGETLEQRPVSVTPDQLEQALSKFRGDIEQIPPMYSAIKIGGKKLCDLARQGVTVEREAREVTIHSLKAEKINEREYTLDVRCSKGTYIRTLCADIGARLGCGGAMKTLCRASASGFTLDDAHTLTELENMTESEREACVFAVEHIFLKHRQVILPDFFAKLAHSGLEIYLKKINLDLPLGTLVRLSDKEGFFALGEVLEYADGLAIKPIRQFE